MMTDTWYTTKEWYAYFNNLTTEVSNDASGFALLLELRQLASEYHNTSISYQNGNASNDQLMTIKESFYTAKTAMENWLTEKNTTE